LSLPQLDIGVPVVRFNFSFFNFRNFLASHSEVSEFLQLCNFLFALISAAMSGAGNFDYLIGIEFTLYEAILSLSGASGLFIDNILSEEYQTLNQSAMQGLGSLFAVLKFSYHNPRDQDNRAWNISPNPR
jgi:hypothetical protein